MSSTPSPTVAQDLLALVKSDVLTSFGGPLLVFLTQLQVAGADPIKIGAAWIQLQGAAIGAAPSLVGQIEAQLASALATKLQAAMAIPAKVA